MAIGGVGNGGNLAGLERSQAELRRASGTEPGQIRQRDSDDREAGKIEPRQEFLLGATAYRRVLATLESDATADGKPRVLREDGGSYTSQRAQRAYQETARSGDDERESVTRLFGVDVFA